MRNKNFLKDISKATKKYANDIQKGKRFWRYIDTLDPLDFFHETEINSPTFWDKVPNDFYENRFKALHFTVFELNFGEAICIVYPTDDSPVRFFSVLIGDESLSNLSDEDKALLGTIVLSAPI